MHDGNVSDPVINHVWLLNANNWTHTYAPSTDFDDDNVTRGSGTQASMVKYILYAEPPSANSSSVDVFRQVAESVVYGCLSPSNQCFSTSARAFLCSLYMITGITPGITSISDGGNDMYVLLSLFHILWCERAHIGGSCRFLMPLIVKV